MLYSFLICSSFCRHMLATFQTKKFLGSVKLQGILHLTFNQALTLQTPDIRHCISIDREIVVEDS